MGSEQIYVDDKFVGEIIQLDEKWTIRIDFGFLEDDICLSPFHDTFRKDLDKGNFFLRKVYPEVLQKVLDSLGKYDRYDSNIRRISLYEDGNFVSDIFDVEFHD